MNGSKTYERAAARVSVAQENLHAVKTQAARAVQAAELDLAGAEMGLAQLESRPGVPLPKYRLLYLVPALSE